MEISGGLGGGVMLALAAGLWLVYLVPSWLRRREYLATERNAVRLQQTLRVLAATAEVPDAVRAETNARSIAQHQAIVREQQRSLAEQQKAELEHARRMAAAERTRDAAARRMAQRAMIDAQPAIAGIVAARRRAAFRLRRTRALASLLLFAALVTAGVQGVIMATAGIAMGAWAVLGFSAVVTVSSVALLGRLAAVSRTRSVEVARQTPVIRRVVTQEPVAENAAPAVPWTPVPVPKPLYLSRGTVRSIEMDRVVVEADVAAAELRAASAASTDALRLAQQTLPAIKPRVDPAAAEPRRLQNLDIDEVLRRRRQAS